MTEEKQKIEEMRLREQRRRSLVLAWVMVGFIFLVILVTIFKLGPAVLERGF